MSLWRELEAKPVTSGQLLGHPWKVWDITLQMSYVEAWWHQNWVHSRPILCRGGADTEISENLCFFIKRSVAPNLQIETFLGPTPTDSPPLCRRSSFNPWCHLHGILFFKCTWVSLMKKIRVVLKLTASPFLSYATPRGGEYLISEKAKPNMCRKSEYQFEHSWVSLIHPRDCFLLSKNAFVFQIYLHFTGEIPPSFFKLYTL